MNCQLEPNFFVSVTKAGKICHLGFYLKAQVNTFFKKVSQQATF
jgi:hypothetical protein